jgi:hypothetical protein
MRRQLVVIISAICGALLWPAGHTFAQARLPDRVLAGAAPNSGGRILGFVRDATGRAIAEASVMALGRTVISARSDAAGRFLLALPAGEYVLRASRAGYVSTYREAVRVDGRTRLEREITLTRQDAAVADAASAEHAHTDLAWRLRHLKRSVLRDGTMVVPGSDGMAPDGRRAAADRARDRSARFAAALADTDFRGDVNFVTTAFAEPASNGMPVAWPRGVAFVSVGAPIDGHGAWQVRAALASGEGTAWNVLGEYHADPDAAHAWDLRLSYATQGYTRASDRLTAAVADARSVAGVSGRDRWRVSPGLDLDYGIRAERFDYLADPYLFGANVGLTVRLMPRTHLRASVSQRMVAPGADEFLPPASSAWLPAERTFVPLFGRGALRAEQVRHGEIRLAHRFADDARAPTVHVRRFRQQAHDQIATLFGVPGGPGPGHYFVAHVGDVDVVGWGVGASGRFSRRLRGQVEYARVSAAWDPTDQRLHDIRRAAASVLRDRLEFLHDLTASLHALVEETSTQVSVVYRASTAFSMDPGAVTPRVGSRFDVQVRQGLPYQPTRGSRLEVLFSVRNLFRDVRGEASWYDELLTVAPPLRLMGGIQVRF